MAAILKSAILDSDIAIVGLRHLVIFSQIHSKTLSLLPDSNQFNLTQTHSFSPNLMMSAILKSAILDSSIFEQRKTSLIHSDPTLWWQSSWILPSWIQQFCTKLCLKLIHSDSTWWCQTSWILPSWIQPFWTRKKLHSFILTQLDDVRHLEFCHLGFSHFEQKNNFTHSFWLNLMMSDIYNSAIFDSAIFNKKKNFTHSFWLNLMMAAILNSSILECGTAILDLDTLLSSLRFTQKHSLATLTLTQTN